jgi:hypothetical protein
VLLTTQALPLVIACSIAAPSASAAPAPIYGFPSMGENCENPHTCGFACGPCSSCPNDGPDLRKRQRGFGLIEIEIRDAVTGEPVPHAGISVELTAPRTPPEGARPGRPDVRPQKPARFAASADAKGKISAVLRVGTWSGHAGRGEPYPNAKASFEVVECRTTVELSVAPLSREHIDPKILTAGTTCDRRILNCRAAEGACPAGFVRSTAGGCFGACVPLDACLCAAAAECPVGTCDRQRCREK